MSAPKPIDLTELFTLFDLLLAAFDAMAACSIPKPPPPIMKIRDKARARLDAALAAMAPP